MKQDLIEYSAVPVPSNPDALQLPGVGTKGFSDNEIKAMRAEMAKWVETAQKLCSCPVKANTGDLTMVKAGAISYKDAHPDGTPLSAKDAKWNAAKERAAATKAEHFKIMHAGFTGDDENDKSAYVYPHHKGTPPHEVNLKAVKRAFKAASLMMTPDQDENGQMIKDAGTDGTYSATSSGDVDHYGFTNNDNAVVAAHMQQHITEFNEPLPQMWDASTPGQPGTAKSETKAQPQTEPMIKPQAKICGSCKNFSAPGSGDSSEAGCELGSDPATCPVPVLPAVGTCSKCASFDNDGTNCQETKFPATCGRTDESKVAVKAESAGDDATGGAVVGPKDEFCTDCKSYVGDGKCSEDSTPNKCGKSTKTEKKAMGPNADACGKCKSFSDGECSDEKAPTHCGKASPNDAMCDGCPNYKDDSCEDGKNPPCQKSEKKDVEDVAENKGVIGYKKTPLAPEDQSWDGPGQIAAATPDDLKVMCTWVDSSGDPDSKGSYKLPHHMAGGQHSCVLAGVRGCGGAVQGARSPLQVPSGDLPGIKAHLEKHYHEFGDKAPWEPDTDGKSAEEKEYETMMDLAKKAVTTKIGRTLSASNVGALNEALGNFSEGFQAHAEAMKAHEAVTKNHAKAADAHEKAMKCYKDGISKIKTVLGKEEGGEDDQSTMPEDVEPPTPGQPAPQEPGSNQPQAKGAGAEDIEEVYVIDIDEFKDVMKETVSEFRKAIGK